MSLYTQTLDRAIRKCKAKDAVPDKVLENVAKRTKIDKRYIRQRTLGNGDIEFSNTLGDPIALYKPKSDTTFFYAKDSKPMKDAPNYSKRIEGLKNEVRNKPGSAERVIEKLKSLKSDPRSDKASWVKFSNGHSYVKIGPNKFQFNTMQEHAIGGTYTAEQLVKKEGSSFTVIDSKPRRK